MTIWVFLIGSIIGVLVGVTVSYRTAVTPLHQQIDKLTSAEHNTESMKHYPYSLTNFRYLGTPVDGIQFEDDKILFVQLSTNNIRCTPEQDHIKKLIETGHIGWFEFTVP